MRNQLLARKFRIRIIQFLSATAVALVGMSIAPGAALADEDFGPVGAYTFAGLADYDRDGNVDIVARDNTTSKLWLYPGISTRGYSNIPRVEIGNGW